MHDKIHVLNVISTFIVLLYECWTLFLDHYQH